MIRKKQDIPKIEFMCDSLVINKEVLVFSDLHIGFEDILVGKGIFPRHQLKNIIEKLNDIFFNLNMREIKLKKIIILGDLKHEFGEISDAEWRETIKILDFLIKHCKEIILIKGNHDNILGPVVSKKGIEVRDYYKTNGICFLHGHKLPKGCENAKILILGHLHPAISLSDNYKKEIYKCFLKGGWDSKQVYILPSFSEINIGYDLTNHNYNLENEKYNFVVPEKKFREFKVIVYNNKDKKEYNFGKLNNL